MTTQRIKAELTIDIATLKMTIKASQVAEYKENKEHFQGEVFALYNQIMEDIYNYYKQEIPVMSILDEDMRKVLKDAQKLIFGEETSPEGKETAKETEETEESAETEETEVERQKRLFVEAISIRIESQFDLLTIEKAHGNYNIALEHQKALQQLFYTLTDLYDEYFQSWRKESKFYEESVKLKKEILKEMNNDSKTKIL